MPDVKVNFTTTFEIAFGESLGLGKREFVLEGLAIIATDIDKNFSKNKLAERDTDGSADYVRRLAASSTPVGPPILAIR